MREQWHQLEHLEDDRQRMPLITRIDDLAIQRIPAPLFDRRNAKRKSRRVKLPSDS
jgi:hypothetical protein